MSLSLFLSCLSLSLSLSSECLLIPLFWHDKKEVLGKDRDRVRHRDKDRDRDRVREIHHRDITTS